MKKLILALIIALTLSAAEQKNMVIKSLSCEHSYGSHTVYVLEK